MYVAVSPCCFCPSAGAIVVIRRVLVSRQALDVTTGRKGSGLSSSCLLAVFWACPVRAVCPALLLFCRERSDAGLLRFVFRAMLLLDPPGGAYCRNDRSTGLLELSSQTFLGKHPHPKLQAQRDLSLNASSKGPSAHILR